MQPSSLALRIYKGTTFRARLRVMQPSLEYRDITVVLNQSPVRLTVEHGLPTDWPVWIEKVQQLPALNRAPIKQLPHLAEVVDATTLEINAINAAGLNGRGGQIIYHPPLSLTGATAELTLYDKGAAVGTLPVTVDAGGWVDIGWTDEETDSFDWTERAYTLDVTLGSGDVLRVYQGVASVVPAGAVMPGMAQGYAVIGGSQGPKGVSVASLTFDAEGRVVATLSDGEVLTSEPAPVVQQINATASEVEQVRQEVESLASATETAKQSAEQSALTASTKAGEAGAARDQALAAAAQLAHASGRPVTALGALQAAAARRVDVVIFGDSHVRFGGHGFEQAFAALLGQKYGAYATAMDSNGPFGAATGAPAALQGFALDSPLYSYIAAGQSHSGSSNQGQYINSIASLARRPLDAKNRLRVHFSYGMFPEGSGSFRVNLRLEQSPYTTIGTTGPISTSGASYARVMGALDIAADANRTAPLYAARFAIGGNSITGPFIGYFIRIEDRDATKGVCVHTSYAQGGQSLYDFVAGVRSKDATRYASYFAEVRRLQIEAGQKPIVIIYISSGHNDRNETLSPSLGWRQSSVPSGPEAYLDNLEALQKCVKDVWQKQGWDDDELYFLIVPSHPVSTPDDALLLRYQLAATSQAYQRTSVVDWRNFTSHQEMQANSWYQDGLHLTQAGYFGLTQKLLDSL